MRQQRKTGSDAMPGAAASAGRATANTAAASDVEDLAARRPFTARSVVASTLLGVDPPRLPTRMLVRSGELFGISPGTTRVALSRMVAAGELVVDGDGHRLAGRLLDRQARQRVSRAPATRPWDGTWWLAVVTETRRPASARAELRAAMVELRLVEWREGVWLRPDNLDETSSSPQARAVVDAQCHRFVGRPEPDDGLEGQLWDLGGWALEAVRLRRRLAQVVTRFDAGDTEALAPGFVLSAEVLRHLLADPLLPDELLGPDWPGPALRADYDRYDQAFKTMWRDWFRRQSDR
jgi:phenylacetic acid degradation operon negative regulatory protein